MPQESLQQKIEFLKLMTSKLELFHKEGTVDKAQLENEKHSIFDDQQESVDVGGPNNDDTEKGKIPTKRGFHDRRGFIDSRPMSSEKGLML